MLRLRLEWVEGGLRGLKGFVGGWRGCSLIACRINRGTFLNTHTAWACATFPQFVDMLKTSSLVLYLHICEYVCVWVCLSVSEYVSMSIEAIAICFDCCNATNSLFDNLPAIDPIFLFAILYKNITCIDICLLACTQSAFSKSVAWFICVHNSKTHIADSKRNK